MLGRQKKWVVASLVLFIVNALAILAVTKVTVAMVDQGIVARDGTALTRWSLVLLGLGVTSALAGIRCAYAALRRGALR